MNNSKTLVYYYHDFGINGYSSNITAIFLNELSKYFDTIYFIGYSGKNNASICCALAPNVKFLSLGKKRNFIIESLLGIAYGVYFRYRLRRRDKEVISIVRLPSPAGLGISLFLRNVNYLIVGSYNVIFKHRNIAFKFAVNFYRKCYAILTAGLLKGGRVFSNSEINARDLNCQVDIVRTSTLSEEYIIPSGSFEGISLVNRERINLLYVGRIDESKGIVELIDCLYILNLDQPRFNLVLVGFKDEDKRRREYLENYIEKCGVKDNVIFREWIVDKQDLYKTIDNCDIFISLSKHEGFPRIFWEVLARGRLIVSTDVGSIAANLANPKAVEITQGDSVSAARTVTGLVELESLDMEARIENGLLHARHATVQLTTRNFVEKLYSND